MEKTIGNYTGQPNMDFPMDCETLEALAGNQAMAEILGNICGDKTILLGCEQNTAGTSRGEGYVFLRTQDYPEGEVLHFVGGAVGSGLHVETADVSVTADGYQYPKAYTTRRLVPGLGTETYSWDDFAAVSTNRELARKVAELQDELARAVGEPIGTIKMWPKDTPPANYLLCDGGAIPNEEQYSALRSLVGNNTPDLRGRFVVAYDNADTDYNAIGKQGGEKKHTLTVGEMPSHSHNYYGDDNLNYISGNEYNKIASPNGYDATSNNGSKYPAGKYKTENSGSGQSHENRPPYYVLAYIIKAK